MIKPELHIFPKKNINMSEAEIIALNQVFWDERAEIHALSDLYNLNSFINNKEIRIDKYQVEEMGNITGKNIIHLQCHIGTESISLAHLGANVTGLDFSENAITLARQLAQKCDIDARFICSDVYLAPTALEGEKFDIAYVSVGSIRCLPDLDKWASTVADLLKPTGFLYMQEIHPIVATMASNHPVMILDYFDSEARLWEESGSYTDKPSERVNKQTKNNLEVGFDRNLGQIFSSIINAGLKIDTFKERSGHPNQVFDYLEQHTDSKYYAPENIPEMPATYTLKATKLEV